MGSEKLNLKWNDFQSNISETFSCLRSEEKLLDVSLVSEDLVEVSAHQVVLCAGSKYFRRILSLANTKHHNPLICLQGVKGQDLQAALDYIYHGEVEVLQTDLESFLSVAQRLELGGLSNTDRPPSYQDVPAPENKSGKKERKKKRKKSLPIKIEDNTSIVAAEDQQIDISTTATVDSKISEVEENILKNIGKRDNGMYYCLHCDKENWHRGHMKNHVESHIEGLSFPCEKCGKIFRSRNSIQSHNSQIHRQEIQSIKKSNRQTYDENPEK